MQFRQKTRLDEWLRCFIPSVGPSAVRPFANIRIWELDGRTQIRKEVCSIINFDYSVSQMMMGWAALRDSLWARVSAFPECTDATAFSTQLARVAIWFTLSNETAYKAFWIDAAGVRRLL